MNVIDFLQSNGVPFKRHGEHHHSRRGWVSVDCPKCSPGWNRFRLGFEIATGRTCCWVCGLQNGVAVLTHLTGVSLRDTAAVLRLGHGAERQAQRSHTGRLSLPRAGDLLPAHRKYLLGRQFDPDEIASLWGIRGIGPTGDMKWRILIPICDKIGRVVSWTTRAINDKTKARYISAKEDQESVPHKEILYGAHLAKHAIVVAEGPIDAWAIGPGGVGTLGIGFTHPQMCAMMEYPIRVVCFDAEDAAQTRAEELCRELSSVPGIVENVVLETGKDPAECDRREIADLRAKFF